MSRTVLNMSFFEHPFLGRGFRPFFALGALYSLLSLSLWGGFYMGMPVPLASVLDPVAWHAHEMIYGFTMAIVAGFLLTAVANWTGGAPARQVHLAGLCAIWLAGRIAMNVDIGVPFPFLVVIEGAFIPALAVSLAIPLLRSWNKRNFVFLLLLSILFICDMTFLMTQSRAPLYMAVMVIMAMISLIGGRVIPAFTVAALRRRGEDAFQHPQGRLDALALISLAILAVLIVVTGGQGILTALVAAFSLTVHALRFRRYHTRRILNDPMVWILHAGYGWLMAGIGLIGLAALGVVQFSVALHALTAGAIGSMTLGMMARVALGHTGRDLKANRLTVAAFVLMQLAVLLRVLGVLLWPDGQGVLIAGSASLWAACFGLYLAVYIPILWQPRPDGRPA